MKNACVVFTVCAGVDTCVCSGLRHAFVCTCSSCLCSMPHLDVAAVHESGNLAEWVRHTSTVLPAWFGHQEHVHPACCLARAKTRILGFRKNEHTPMKKMCEHPARWNMNSNAPVRVWPVDFLQHPLDEGRSRAAIKQSLASQHVHKLAEASKCSR